MRPLVMLGLTAVILLVAGPAAAARDFAPNPRQAFDGFVGINPPRSDVPVGALWIDGYGPTGDGAGTDNLETVRSLNGLTIDKNLQLELSVSLLGLFGIDPRARDHYVAHFTDLSIVRVKDVSRLTGTKGEPRVIEALKAGSVSVLSDAEVGLTGAKNVLQSPIQGSTTNDRTRNYAIDAHDMFIAIHVATPELTASTEHELPLAKDGKSARIDDFVIVVSTDCAKAPLGCLPRLGVSKLNSQTAQPAEMIQMGPEMQMRAKLPVPISDGHGGLFDSVRVRWVPACAERNQKGCGRSPHLFGHYEGTRLADVRSVKAPRW